MAKEAKVDYDQENDVLYVYSGEKAKDSLEIDEFVLDISSDNKIVGVEIFDAVKLLSSLLNVKLSKQALEHISNVRMMPFQSKELLYVLLFFSISIGSKRQEVNISVP